MEGVGGSGTGSRGGVYLGGALRFPPVAWRVLPPSVVACGAVLGLLRPSGVRSAPEQCLGRSWAIRNAPVCFGCLLRCCAGNARMQCLAHAWARVPGLWAPPSGPSPTAAGQARSPCSSKSSGAAGSEGAARALFWPEFLGSIREDAPCDAGDGWLGRRAGGGGQRLRLLSCGSGRLRPVAACLSLEEGSGALPPWPMRTPALQRPASALRWKMGVRVSAPRSLCVLVISTFDDLCSLERCTAVLQVQRGKVPDVQIKGPALC